MYHDHTEVVSYYGLTASRDQETRLLNILVSLDVSLTNLRGGGAF
jgi:hypothetical protein